MLKGSSFIIVFFFCAVTCAQDLEFRTIVHSPVVVGESFSVQYVFRHDGPEQFILPVYHGFRVVSGPSIYTSNIPGISKSHQVKNFVVTLVTNQIGKHIIPGATVTIDGKKYRSNDNFIEVIAAEKKNSKVPLGGSEYFLRPGENIDEKLRSNLFVKVVVDRKACYVGQPITATYKLYSRLESKSDIVKNPGFYGFTVHDVVGLNDHQVNSEKIDGKDFDVHTIRRVLLYPLREGVFVIDPMQILNRVEFSRSIVNRHPGQEISEGILRADEDSKPKDGTVTATNEISTEEVSILVNRLPEKGQPSVFTGAVGTFNMAVSLKSNSISINENGLLEISLQGSGNFTQINPPIVKWPSGVEGIDITVSDSLDSHGSILRGTRTFRYSFVSSTPRSFVIPPIQLSYFNPDTGKYRILESASFPVSIIQHRDIGKYRDPENTVAGRISPVFWVLVPVLLIGGLIIFKRGSRKQKETPVLVTEDSNIIFLEKILSPINSNSDNRSFFESVHTAIWKFLAKRFEITGSRMNKSDLLTLLTAQIGSNAAKQIMSIIEECETGMFSDAYIEAQKESLLRRTKTGLEKLI